MVRSVCKQCGAEVVKRRPRKFCSYECYGQWISETKRGPDAPRWNGGKVKVNCAQCGTTLTRSRSEVENRSERFFCDLTCRGRWMSENMQGEQHPMWEGNHLETGCAFCGKPLTIPRWRATRANRFFCDYKCMGNWSSENLCGDKRYNWKGGKLPYYGPSWHAQKKRARKRDKYRCQECGITQKSLGRALDVHHIIPFREFGYVIGENSLDWVANCLSNLISLCPSCHKQVEHRGLT